MFFRLRGKVNYGMPVKDVLHDAIGYSKQIEEARRSYHIKEKGNGESYDEVGLLVGDGILKIKLTSEEFLSRWRKGDKLIPIITAVMYLGDFPWDVPKACLRC